MTLTVTPPFDAVVAKLADLIVSILPSVPPIPPVIQLQANRTPMPLPVPAFVGLTPMLQRRIATNFEHWAFDQVIDGVVDYEQSVSVAVQCDFYGANAADWAMMFATVMRSEYACRQLAPTVAPLYNDDPRQSPLIDGEEQYETRWIVTAYVQYNPITSTPEQFATVLAADLINVDERYPP